MQLDWREENAKVERLELLYEKDGRSDRSHPLHGVYTGLALEAPSAAAAGASSPPEPTASGDPIAQAAGEAAPE